MKSIAIAVLIALAGGSALAQCGPSLREWSNPPRPLPVRGSRGMAIGYWLIDLGTDGVVACAEIDGERLSISRTIRERQAGDQGRSPFPWENTFDAVTGQRWYWVGFARSGARDWPGVGAIGDLNVACLNRFDCIAKQHDLENWLAAHFVEGAEIHIVTRMRGAWVLRVPRGLDIQLAAERDFHDAADHTLRRARNWAVQARDNALVGRIDGLLNELRFGGRAGTAHVVNVIFNDRKLSDAIPPP